VFLIQEMLGTPLPKWESFYVIVGSSAGALTGLQFVVMALVADMRRRASFDTIDAFGTPTIVHFCVALALSAILSAPWPSLTGPAFFLALAGVVGIGYVAIVTMRARRQKGYVPVLEDWIWHVCLPFLAYVMLLIGSTLLSGNGTVGLFMIGAMSVLLLFVGIHNAWDTVTYLVIERLSGAETPAVPEE
jgi:hypothetical protein